MVLTMGGQAFTDIMVGLYLTLLLHFKLELLTTGFLNKHNTNNVSIDMKKKQNECEKEIILLFHKLTTVCINRVD
jgi:hypothetical protein